VESVRLAHELLSLSQNELTMLAGLSQSAISAIELGCIKFSVERSKVLAQALKGYPAILVFSNLAHLETV
jgi:predicted transcriptional regulator